ncbi:MAG: methyltransferase domain-containing protein [Planctomycetota bacterium]
MNLKTRDRQDEWMDQPDLSTELHAGALRGLSRVNRFSGVVGSLWKPIASWAETAADTPISLLDVASGGGDVAIGVDRRAKRASVAVRVTGCDISPFATEYATRQAERVNADVRFLCRDVLADAMPESYDIVYTSLFLHHLEQDSLLEILDSMRTIAKHRVILSDLIRSRLGYSLAKYGIRLLTRNPVCHVDGPLSVRAALTIDEMVEHCQRVGLKILERRKVWPERFLFVCDPS